MFEANALFVLAIGLYGHVQWVLSYFITTLVNALFPKVIISGPVLDSVSFYLVSFNKYASDHRNSTATGARLAYGQYIIWYEGTPVLCDITKDDRRTTMTLIGLTFRKSLFSDLIAQANEFMPPNQIYIGNSSTAGIWYDQLTNFWMETSTVSDVQVIMDPKVESALRTALDRFKDIAWYRKHKIPHSCNILLYGPPGNGKTSIVRWIASEYKKSIGLLTLGTIYDDHFPMLNTSISRNCMFVFEDINFEDANDVKKRLAKKQSLLNLLDGVSESGRITIITTNYVETLPPELLRDERIHVSIEVVCTEYIREHLLRKFDAYSESNMAECADMNAASIQAHCRRIHLPRVECGDITSSAVSSVVSEKACVVADTVSEKACVVSDTVSSDTSSVEGSASNAPRQVRHGP
jgi:hypothetical protein